MSKKPAQIYQFKITLTDSKPPIWRRILVPDNYTFWDLHVAIQDAMGWLDYHLHVFEITDPETNEMIEIGMPDELDFGTNEVLDDYKVKMSKYLNESNKNAVYEYDFGDSWRHKIVLEKILPAVPGEKYPQCIAGKMSCPPEDCGGTYCYYDFLEILKDPSHENHKELKAWAGKDFDPEYFDPKDVVFDNPKERFKLREG